MSEKNIPLTSAEIASLWTAYMNDSMSKYVLQQMLKYIEDQDIKPIIQFAFDLASDHMDKLLAFFKQEKFAPPNGFTKRNVNMEAPRLFSDTFCLTYVNHMAKVGLLSYAGIISMCSREDIRSYFTKALNNTTTLYNQSQNIAIVKGVNARHPYIEVPKEIDFIDSKKYLSGLNPLSSKRPLNAIEITHLYANVMTNSIGIKLCIGFSQTSPTKEIQEYMLRGKEISIKHVKIFASTLLENDIESPQLPDVAISNSTTPTFSDKLIMFQMSLLSAAGIGNYAMAAAASQRSDLVVNYERLSLEIAQFAKDGATIMIKNNWLEQPPGTKDRTKLAKNKN
ncbi:DUF3231 family protein [Lederbergia wuyishanensis]|uniref:DUF3231 family protein n=1 Tax=Lederbergia wuyishanensis TaxID=1347903 RepID=A0ABU0DAF2_9BACI|nr:DUF3231 family protein [Lederbergia wuyishanensis]MCJ8009963.1 DUF3231 family protein [Lederbergia wuyishanensis]MDQ0345311.1 hypothetical protein [Lederbergia wuyishanensis]